MELQDRIIKLDWHRRFAQLELLVARKKALVWAGVDIACEAARCCENGLTTGVRILSKKEQMEKVEGTLVS